MSKADLSGADLSNADLAGASLKGGKAYRHGLVGREIERCRPFKANLSGAYWVDGRKCGEGSVGECKKDE